MPLVDLKSDLTFYGRPPGIGLGKSLSIEAVDESVRAAKSIAPTSMKGVLNIVKQQGLQLLNPNVESKFGTANPTSGTKFFDPKSLIDSTLGQITGVRNERHSGIRYQDIIKSRGDVQEQIDFNRLVVLKQELLPDYEQGISSPGLGPILSLSAAGGPRGLYTQIDRYVDTSGAEYDTRYMTLRSEQNPYGAQDYNIARLGLQADTSPLEDTIDNVRVETDERFANIETYNTLTYGQIIGRRKARTPKSPDIDWATGDTWAEKAPSEYAEVNGMSGKLVTFKVGSIRFKAYIESISDSINANWQSSKDQGRADERYLYTGYNRNVSVSFIVAVETKAQATSEWNKLNSLAKLAFPAYNSNGYYGDLTRVTIGDIYKSTPMILTNISYDWDNESPWSLVSTYDDNYNGPSDRPMITRVNCEFIYIGSSKQTNSNAKFG